MASKMLTGEHARLPGAPTGLELSCVTTGFLGDCPCLLSGSSYRNFRVLEQDC